MRYFAVLKAAVKDFFDDDALRLAAALSFYTMLSLAPLLLIIASLAGAIWGAEPVREAVVEQFGSVIGPRAAEQIEAILTSSGEEEQKPLSALTGIVVLIVGATGVFGQLKDTLNAIWDVKLAPAGGWRKSGKRLLRKRALSMVMVAGLAFLFVVSLLLSTGIDAFAEWAGSLFGIPSGVLIAMNTAATLILFMLIFAASFKVLPDVRMRWKDVFLGAAVTALLLVLGKLLLSFYFANSSLGSAYGAAGALVVILVWVYYAGVIFFFGAELTQAYMRERGQAIEPSRGAVRIK